jgi:Spy/CpxP family protein refolding chaperone
MASMMKPLLVLLSLVLNGAFVAAWVSSQHNSSPAKPCHVEADSCCPLQRKLGLTDDQWKKLEPGLQVFRKACQAQCQELCRLRGQLINLLAAAEPDRKKIAAKQREILKGQEKMQDLVVEQLLAARAFLTPQQQKGLFDLIRSQCGFAEQAGELGCASDAALNAGNKLPTNSLSQRKSS